MPLGEIEEKFGRRKSRYVEVFKKYKMNIRLLCVYV